MVNSVNEGIHGIEFHSIDNQTTQRNLVNGIDHSNSITFRRILANQMPPKTIDEELNLKNEHTRLNCTNAQFAYFLNSLVKTI